MRYDYLVVGAGLFGSVVAHELTKAGKKCLLIDRRNHIAGNAYTEKIEGIDVHVYGAHIFHTSNEMVWDYVNSFTPFQSFTNSPIAIYRGEVYNLPFNMNTFSRMWGCVTPDEARRIINAQVEKEHIGEPRNLEEQALKLVGRDIYEKLVKDYTQKQWGCPCSELPAFIIKRLPLRFTYDNNYFNDRFQGIPEKGYTELVRKMIEGIDIRLNTEYAQFMCEEPEVADTTVYTGMIDEYYDYRLGELCYRGLRFDTKVLDTENYQGNAVVNYTSGDVPWTRIIEHKHFAHADSEKTIISYEYPQQWKRGDEPFYPVNNAKNDALYRAYRALAEKDKRVIFGGRLGEYRYYDMDQVILSALKLANRLIGGQQ